ncbi:MAG: hypothetical protein Ct9H90mP13_01230 [Pseudomonadota bacterium]|nr:MAG: hypothetical protein Ct9H90mP13_01230 [Pseudomonadota bacterium]
MIRTRGFFTLGPQMTATGLYSGKKSIDRKAQALKKLELERGKEANPPNIYMYFLSAFI